MASGQKKKIREFAFYVYYVIYVSFSDLITVFDLTDHFHYIYHDLLYNRPAHFIHFIKKKHCENVSEKEPIFADEGATVRALLKNKNAEKYV
jgi:hypothetical protein